MLFHTHILIGLVAFLIGKDYLPGNIYLILLLILLGSILPDIDEHKSKAAQLSGLLGRIVAFFSRHRGIFHSITISLVFCVLLGWLWAWYYAAALFIGYVAHLLADALTPMGVPIFYPFTEFRLRGPFRTGGVWEWIIRIILILLILREVF